MASDLMARAQQGDAGAIAQLLNLRARPLGLAVKVRPHAEGLRILLEAAAVPDQAQAVKLLRRELRAFGLAHQTIQVAGRQFGATDLAWHTQLDLTTSPPAESVATPTTKAAAMPQPPSKQPFTLTVADVQQFGASLDPLKAGFLVLLLIYGIFGPPNYTVPGAIAGQDRIMTFLHGGNLIFHEAGHIFFMIFGRFIGILGGSLMQILVPAGIAVYFFWTRQRYASMIALCWMAQNFWDVSVYMRDAAERALPLLGGISEEYHDWYNLLSDLGILTWDDALANLVMVSGVIIYFAAIAGGFYWSRQASS